MKNMQNEKGLTLIEMIVVLSILTLIVGVAIPFVSDFRDHHGMARQKEQFARIAQGFELMARVKLLKDPDGNLRMDNFVFSNTGTGTSPGHWDLIDSTVLVGSAGASGLSYWFADEVQPPAAGSQDYRLLDFWGNPIDFPNTSDDGSTPAPSAGAIVSAGPSGDATISAFVFPLEAMPVLREEGMTRKTMIETMIYWYWKDFAAGFPHHPNMWEQYETDAASLNSYDDLTLASYLNEDPRWNCANSSSIRFKLNDWLHLKLDLVP